MQKFDRPPVQAHVGTHDAVLDILQKSGPGKLLDIGAGTGHFAKRISAMWNNEPIYVTEIYKECITENGLIVSEVNADSDKIPYPDNFFDYVTLIEIIEHLKNPWNCMGEISRVLKPNGILILSTPNIHNLRSKIHFLFKDTFAQFKDVTYDPTGHLHPFAMNELNMVFEENNFTVERIEYGESYRYQIPWSYYKEHRNARSVVRNFFGYVIRNILYYYTVLVSFLLTGSFSTHNKLFGLNVMFICKKNS